MFLLYVSVIRFGFCFGKEYFFIFVFILMRYFIVFMKVFFFLFCDEKYEIYDFFIESVRYSGILLKDVDRFMFFWDDINVKILEWWKVVVMWIVWIFLFVFYK